jgi:WASH complex subunit 7
MLRSLEERFSDKIDYLNLMVKAFSKLVTKENKHLKLFYHIVPALSINCVEHITRGKEQANKKITSRAFIYDDGFVLGLAYFLTLLKQHDHYKTLHWEEAARTYFAETKKESKAANVDTANHSAKFIEDLNMQKQLLIRKLQFMEEEFTFF